MKSSIAISVVMISFSGILMGCFLYLIIIVIKPIGLKIVLSGFPFLMLICCCAIIGNLVKDYLDYRQDQNSPPENDIGLTVV